MHGLVQKILGTCEREANKFLHPGANYTYMYNLHTVCKSVHVNGALVPVPSKAYISYISRSVVSGEYLFFKGGGGGLKTTFI